MCVAHPLYVLSSLLVNKLPDSSDKSSNQPMAYELCKRKNIKKFIFTSEHTPHILYLNAHTDLTDHTDFF